MLNHLAQDKWGACSPYCFQTRGTSSTFFAYRTFTEGVTRVSELLAARAGTLPRGETIGVEQVRLSFLSNLLG